MSIGEICEMWRDHSQRRVTGSLGQMITVDCPRCSWAAWSYEGYLIKGTADEGRAWLLAEHEQEAHR